MKKQSDIKLYIYENIIYLKEISFSFERNKSFLILGEVNLQKIEYCSIKIKGKWTLVRKDRKGIIYLIEEKVDPRVIEFIKKKKNDF